VVVGAQKLTLEFQDFRISGSKDLKHLGIYGFKDLGVGAIALLHLLVPKSLNPQICKSLNP
jgi:hypothetical protein